MDKPQGTVKERQIAAMCRVKAHMYRRRGRELEAATLDKVAEWIEAGRHYLHAVER